MKELQTLSRGRQVLNFIIQELEMQMYHTPAFNVMTLAKVHMRGNNLAEFNNKWFAVLEQLDRPLDEDSMRDMYLEQLKKAPCLKDDLKWFESLPRGHNLRCYRWLVALTERHINKYKEDKLARAYTETAGNPNFTNILFDHVRRHGPINAHAAIPESQLPTIMAASGAVLTPEEIQAMAFRQTRGRDKSRKGRGRDRSRSGSSRSRTPGGHRKPRPRHQRSASPAFSNGGTYKFNGDGNKRKDKYKSKEICFQWRDNKSCKYGDACKFQHTATPAAKAKGKKNDPLPTSAAASGADPAISAAQLAAFDAAVEKYQGNQHEMINTQHDDFDDRDYDSDSDGTALAFKGARRKGKGKGKGKNGQKRQKSRFARRPPCKFWPLGTCDKGKDCPFFHGQSGASKPRSQSSRPRYGAAATEEPELPTSADADGDKKSTGDKKKGN